MVEVAPRLLCYKPSYACGFVFLTFPLQSMEMASYGANANFLNSSQTCDTLHGGLSKAAPIRVRQVPGVTLILLGGSKLWNSWRRCHFRCALIVRNGARYRPQFTWILSLVCGRLHCRAQSALERIVATGLVLRICCYKMKEQKENSSSPVSLRQRLHW
jgi:hypothetical protein